jgi:hypothetical protein
MQKRKDGRMSDKALREAIRREWAYTVPKKDLIDRIKELEDHLASMTGLWAKSDSEKQLLLGRIEGLEAKHTELVSAVKDLLHDVKYSLLDEELSDGEGYELWEDVKKFRRVVCAAGLAELKGQNDD